MFWFSALSRKAEVANLNDYKTRNTALIFSETRLYSLCFTSGSAVQDGANTFSKTNFE